MESLADACIKLGLEQCPLLLDVDGKRYPVGRFLLDAVNERLGFDKVYSEAFLAAGHVLSLHSAVYGDKLAIERSISMKRSSRLEREAYGSEKI